MNAASLIDRLGRIGSALPALVAGLPSEDARWKPASGAWSVLEIMRHMLDEETFDFRVRLRLTLEAPSQPWPPTNPERWAIDRAYNDDPRGLNSVAQAFADARRESVAWLRSLRNPDWNSAHHHAKHGPLHAGMLLASWAAHDALHVRQIAKRMFELASRDAPEYSTRYAGEWTT